MLKEYCKCRFCKWYDNYEGCEAICHDYDEYEPVTTKIIEKAKEEDISVADVLVLIDLENSFWLYQNKKLLLW